MSSSYKKIKMGQTPGDLSPEKKKNHPTPVGKAIVRRKTRAQQREQKRKALKEDA